MKYLVGQKDFELRLCEKPVPQPQAGQVLVRVLGCGVCGTDLHFLRKNADWTPLGHEISAEVVSVGSGVTRFQEGARVVVEDVGACGCCPSCQKGDPGRCSAMLTLQGQSGMGEYLLAPQSLLVPCDGLTAMEACFVEPLTVCYHAVHATELAPNAALAVWGMGPLGLMSIRLARHFGAGTIVAIGSRRSARNDVRGALARELGADAVLYALEDTFEAELAKLPRLDAALVTSPPKTLPQAVFTAGYGARIVPIGIDLGTENTVNLDVDHLILNKKSIVPVLSEPALQFPLSVELLRRGVVPTDKLLTHTVKLSDTARLREIFASDPTVIKAVVVPD